MLIESSVFLVSLYLDEVYSIINATNMFRQKANPKK